MENEKEWPWRQEETRGQGSWKQVKKVLPSREGHHEPGQILLTGQAGKGLIDAHLL